MGLNLITWSLLHLYSALLSCRQDKFGVESILGGFIIPSLHWKFSYRRWPLQSPHPRLLGISSSVTPINWVELPIPDLYRPRDSPTSFHFLFSSSSAPFLISILIPILPHFPPFSVYFISLLSEIQTSLLGPPYYLISLGLCIVIWLSYTLWLLSTYKWVSYKCIFWVLLTSLRVIFSSPSGCLKFSWCLCF